MKLDSQVHVDENEVTAINRNEREEMGVGEWKELANQRRLRDGKEVRAPSTANSEQRLAHDSIKLSDCLVFIFSIIIFLILFLKIRIFIFL